MISKVVSDLVKDSKEAVAWAFSVEVEGSVLSQDLANISEEIEDKKLFRECQMWKYWWEATFESLHLLWELNTPEMIFEGFRQLVSKDQNVENVSKIEIEGISLEDKSNVKISLFENAGYYLSCSVITKPFFNIELKVISKGKC